MSDSNQPSNNRKKVRFQIEANIKYLLNIGYQVDILKYFMMIKEQPNSSLLNFAEIIVTRQRESDLYIPKEMVVNHSLS